MTNVPWITKHKPQKFTELYFSDDTHFEALKWLKNCKNGSLLNIIGGCGTGKSVLVYAIAKALDYNVLEISELKFDTLEEIDVSRNLKNTKNLLLVEEFDIPHTSWIGKLSNLKIPVIVVSTSSIGKAFKTLKIQRPSNETVLSCIDSILMREDASVDRKLIFKLCEICNYDLRSIINYCQLFSKNPVSCDLKIVERVSPKSFFSICKIVLSKRSRIGELEVFYSPKIANLCLNSILENSKDTHVFKVFESFSEIYTLPEKYHFLVLDSLNQIQADFVYKKETNVESVKMHGHEDCLNFLQFYKRNLQDRASVAHLQEIFEKYKPKNLSEIDLEIKNFIDFKAIDQKVFKYKYNHGSSSAVKRDIKICEIMDL